jgi:signal transduction histidine kinase
MKGYAKAALEDYGDRLDQRGRSYLEKIVSGGCRMEQLIHDVLTYSRLARSDLKVEPVSLQSLIPEIIQNYPEMQPPIAEIIVQQPLDKVMAHEPSVIQAVSNLLSNAVKFVAPGTTPRVQLWTEAHNGSIRLVVQDNGIGISPKYQHRLFAMFERLQQSSKYEGTGIGLAIVRKAAEKMGGSVGLESDGETGSRFWIELPAAPQ